MRSRVTLPAVLLGALAIAALLMLPRLRAVSVDAAAPEGSSSAGTSLEVEAPAAPVLAPSPPPREDPLPSYVRRDPASDVACPRGMLLVEGIYCPGVVHTCVTPRGASAEACARFADTVICEGTLDRRRFCVDEFEYPNMEGATPAVMVDYRDAKRACAVEGKRLCTAEEWQFACEGPQMWPLPTGSERDSSLCNVGASPGMRRADPVSDDADAGVRDGRESSGRRRTCVSPFGIRDLVGNVAEWVENVGGLDDDRPYRSALGGGDFSSVGARCRPGVTSHDARFKAMSVGFRCCAGTRDKVQRSNGPLVLPRGARHVIVP